MSIAIVGMAGRFPDADTVDALWQLLLDGHEAVHRLDVDELRAGGVGDEQLADPAYMPYGVRLSAIEDVDAGFFKLRPADAALIDPQHRLFMECAWRALEDAAPGPESVIGVFASAGPATYLQRNILRAGDYGDGELPYSVRLGNQVDFLAGRVAYALDLTGPAVAIQSACSSSLVGVDAACTALELGRCDVAVAGAASLRLPHPSGYVYAEGSVWSEDGHCRPFDAAASGWVAGSGGAAVVLKRLPDAIADRDRIHAVIRGVGVNNDGADKMTFSAPSTSGQIGAITRALHASGLPSSAIGYIEAHGTATALGDPIEVDALAKAYAAAGGTARDCALGALKANLGHLDAAAGIAGLIKTSLVLEHQLVPPQINYREPNALLRLAERGFVVHDELYAPETPIEAAAVSALGLGGTNVHMILTAPPGRGRTAPACGAQRLVVSARDDADLRQVAGDLRRHLSATELRIDDVAYTLAHGRRFAKTLVLHAADTDAALIELDRFLDGEPPAPSPEEVASLDAAIKVRLPGYPLHRERHWIELAPPRPPGDGTLLERVTAIFRRHLGEERFGPDDDYFDDGGGDSLTAVEIVDAITDQLGPTVGLSTFIGLRTPRRVTEEVRTWPGGNPVDPMMLQLREGAGEPIFLIHPASGTASCYQRLVTEVAIEGPLFAISYPFDDPDPPEALADMATRYLDAIRAIAPHGPYRLGGYSMGGNLAIELAHRLRSSDEGVRDVVLIDAMPLEAYPRDLDEAGLLRTAPIALSYLLGLPLPTAAPETAEDVVALLRRPTWSRRTEELLRRFVAMYVRSGLALARAERPPRLDTDVTVVSAAEPRNPVFDALGIRSLPRDVWQDYTSGQVRHIEVPGNHYTLYSEHVVQLARILERIYADHSGR